MNNSALQKENSVGIVIKVTTLQVSAAAKAKQKDKPQTRKQLNPHQAREI